MMVQVDLFNISRSSLLLSLSHLTFKRKGANGWGRRHFATKTYTLSGLAAAFLLLFKPVEV